jgi:hypothetical protein
MFHAKPVCMKDCEAFLKKHYRDTWLTPWACKKLNLNYETSFKIKYINFHFDTRDWKVWRITGRGLGNDFLVSTHDEFEGTILELLAQKLELNDPKEGKNNEIRQNKQEAVSSGTAGSNKTDNESSKLN